MSRNRPMRPRWCDEHRRYECAGHRKDGADCHGAPPRGIGYCVLHSGKSRAQAKAEGLVRVELDSWGLADSYVDPGETLLRLVAQSSRRVNRYAVLLAKAYAGDPDFPAAFQASGIAALIGFKYDLTKDGSPVPVEEAVRGLVQLEAEERDRLARFCKTALDAGIAERQVQLAERLGLAAERVAESMLAAFEQLALLAAGRGMPAEWVAVVRELSEPALKAIQAGDGSGD